MRRAKHDLILKSEGSYGSRVPSAAFGGILARFEPAVRDSILMAFEGRSRSGGHSPDWLRAASDIRFVGISGDKDTVVHYEAPQLGEAVEVLYRQKEFWPTRPDPEDTGIDLLGDVVKDIGLGDRDSARFDPRLLKAISRLGRSLDGTFQEMIITGRRHMADAPVTLNEGTTENAQRLTAETPAPEPSRIAGKLDMICDSSRSFALQLDEGEKLRGVLLRGDMGPLAKLFRKRVVILGKAVFRPSGRLLRIDAESVAAATGESRIWSKIPKPRGRRASLPDLRKRQGPRSGIRAVIGRWPGEETEDEIRAALEQIS